MEKNRLYDVLRSICPPDIQDEWDNSGIQINSDSPVVERVLVALEVTPEVIEEAVSSGADMIVTHHPLIFDGLKSIDASGYVDGMVYRLVREGISVYSCHTNFDKMRGGNNDRLGELLGLKNITSFELSPDNLYCRKGEIPGEMSLSSFIEVCSGALDIERSSIRCVGQADRIVNMVGWCTGSGASFLDDAIREGCDLFITGDLKYHDAQKASASGLAVLDIGHYGSEKIFVDNMAEKLEISADAEIIRSSLDIDPFTC